jgi:UDP-glucuronate 4-epimerase
MAATKYAATNYEVINLGNNHTVGLSELIGYLEGALGKKARLEYLPEQAGDVRQTWADVAKAKALLDYWPKTKFHQGLEKFAEWLACSRVH